MSKLKIVFVTGTRADYGKLKSLMKLCDADESLETHIYVTGMHLLPEYGFTFNDILADGYKNIKAPINAVFADKMDENIATTILQFSSYVREINPSLIVIHGDRTDPLAASIVGVLNNVRVAHIEGGEVTGTVDEFLRHAISKLSSLHFVANNESKFRLIQLGEREDAIHVIGSPDIDIMLSNKLPSLDDVKSRNGIYYRDYAILIYHPVTTSSDLAREVKQVVTAVKESKRNYIVIYPNNDHGSDLIRRQLDALRTTENFTFFKSVPFEDFIVLLKHCEFIIGNSSAGIREACVYGVPAIDIGSRQNKRYELNILKNIQHTNEHSVKILECIHKINEYRHTSVYFGEGKSAELFLTIVKRFIESKHDIQKVFVEMDVTMASIKNFMNEVCF